MFGDPFQIIKALLAAWERGGKRGRVAVVLAAVLVTVGLLMFWVSEIAFYSRSLRVLGSILAGLGGVTAFTVAVLQEVRESFKREKKIEEVEQRVKDHPKEPQAAWELARIKLESYLNRNLWQIRSIFWLTAFVMSCGFALIGIGAYEAFRNPQGFNAAVLASVSGTVVSFIGGTFLVLYRSTMGQAREYVTMLERINAVGMSVQILEILDDGDKDLKNKTIAEVAKQLLFMYAADSSISAKNPQGHR